MQVPFNTEARSVSLLEARSLFFGRGELPAALLDNNVLRSWERCRQAGLDPARKGGGGFVSGTGVFEAPSWNSSFSTC